MKNPSSSMAPSAADRGGEHQNLRRMSLALDVLANAPHGLRLAEIAALTQLGKTTVHRLMTGLVDLGWVDQVEEDGSYVLGFRPLTLALAAADRYSLARLSAPRLQQIADITGDTVYLSLGSGTDAVCVARYEGDFPVKTLTLSVGARRPLGVGAGSLALLAFQDEQAVSQTLARNADARARYQISDATLHRLIAEARNRGYALNDGMLVSGMSAIGVPIRASNGRPIAAISVAAISSRLDGGRQQEVARLLQEAVDDIESRLQAVVDFSALGAD
ncbi:IclR family transcriptional regulator [Pusillimonas sp. SM2304]|uniref:IclR family transcriptional regulator n=1 Tax=Pusillimonas sp. SM2304 TaxID=3073241 RepID=UPI0028770AE7|nr:IclR family transcriptional regulator [Pusillimonas sp. SM2304]MDS1140076.1 IclR family transcriptional regulator [Pusillimonas sp. SM2304]